MGTVEIPLYNDVERVALIDAEDLAIVSDPKYRWRSRRDKYTWYCEAVEPWISMHVLLMGSRGTGLQVDHINGNGLDNRRCNLRLVTHRQNRHNLHNGKVTSQYPGVSWYKKLSKWQASIQLGTKRKHLGYFTDEITAYSAFREASARAGLTVF